METKHLRTFITTVELESFTRAARRLGLSQSAISQQISTQERHLGVKLLVRSGRGTKTTPAGEILFRYAKQIVAKMDEAQRMIAEYDEKGTGSIRIGAGGATCEHLLPTVLREFGSRFPKSEISVVSGHSDLTLDRLQAGDLDIGMISMPSQTTGLQTFDLGSDELMAIAPGDHKWNALRRIPRQEFADVPLIVYEKRSSAFRLFEETLIRDGIFPKISMEIDHLGAAVGMIKAGIGVSVLPRWAVQALGHTGRLTVRSIGSGGLFRRWALATRADGHMSQSVKSFVNIGIELLPPLLTI